VQQPPISPKQDNNDPNTSEIIKILDSMYLENVDKISDEELFKQPPLLEDCPICFLRMPLLASGSRYQTCCGKTICSGCSHAPVYDNQGNEVDNKKCPFCRTPTPSSEKETINRYKKRVELEDPIAINNLGCHFRDGTNGHSQSHTKALKLWHRAGELGCAAAYTNIGSAYYNGEGVEVDKKKAIHYFELGAMKGSTNARYNLGLDEEETGNFDRAVTHHMIAVRCGDNDSLKEIQDLYTNGHATKDDYLKALQSYQEYLGEIQSKQRDEAAKADERYRYY